MFFFYFPRYLKGIWAEDDSCPTLVSRAMDGYWPKARHPLQIAKGEPLLSLMNRQRWIVVSFHFTTPDRSMPCHIPKLRQPWCWRGLQQCLGHASLNVGIGYISNGSSSILVKIHFIRFTTSMDHRRRSQRNSKTFGTLQ